MVETKRFLGSASHIESAPDLAEWEASSIERLREKSEIPGSFSFFKLDTLNLKATRLLERGGRKKYGPLFDAFIERCPQWVADTQEQFEKRIYAHAPGLFTFREEETPNDAVTILKEIHRVTREVLNAYPDRVLSEEHQPAVRNEHLLLENFHRDAHAEPDGTYVVIVLTFAGRSTRVAPHVDRYPGCQYIGIDESEIYTLPDNSIAALSTGTHGVVHDGPCYRISKLSKDRFAFIMVLRKKSESDT